MHDWDRDKTLRFNLIEALEDAAAAHAGVDENDNRPCLEKRESQRDEFETGPHHQNQPRAGNDAHSHKSRRQPVAFVFELREREMRIRHPPGSVAPRGKDDRSLMRPPRGGFPQRRGDIDEFGGQWGIGLRLFACDVLHLVASQEMSHKPAVETGETQQMIADRHPAAQRNEGMPLGSEFALPQIAAAAARAFSWCEI